MRIKKQEVKNIIVIGKSGAGKQPRIDIIAEELGFEQLATGTIFRSVISAYKEGRESKEAELGKKAVEYLEAGKFVPDELTNEIFAEHFKKHNYQGCVLDGYPRTEAQAEYFMNLLEENNSRIDMVIEVHRENENIINHIVHRRTCKQCAKSYHLVDKPPKDNKFCYDCDGEVFQRSDDTEENVKSRLLEFNNKVIPVIEYLKTKGIYHAKVDGFLNPWSKEIMKQTVLDALNIGIDLSAINFADKTQASLSNWA